MQSLNSLITLISSVKLACSIQVNIFRCMYEAFNEVLLITAHQALPAHNAASKYVGLMWQLIIVMLIKGFVSDDKVSHQSGNSCTGSKYAASAC